SSPKLRCYSTNDIDNQLNEATMELCRLNIDISTNNTIKLHKIFYWYGLSDFGHDNTRIARWIFHFLTSDQKAALHKIFKILKSSTKCSKKYIQIISISF
ncbi:hypothetical protein GJ496_006463, partial [Pomphorhynchus laevis]